MFEKQSSNSQVWPLDII